MKKLVVLGLVAGAVMLAAGAWAMVQNQVFVTFKNMAGVPYTETSSLLVSADLVGPQLSIAKNQQNYRTSQTGPTIMIASGDSIVYSLTLINSGTDSASAVVISDTLAFAVVGGQTVSYEQGTALPDSGAAIAGGKVTDLEYYNGAIWQGATSATIPTNAQGIRWTIDKVVIGGPYNLGFAVKVTSP